MHFHLQISDKFFDQIIGFLTSNELYHGSTFLFLEVYNCFVTKFVKYIYSIGFDLCDVFQVGDTCLHFFVKLWWSDDVFEVSVNEICDVLSSLRVFECVGVVEYFLDWCTNI